MHAATHAEANTWVFPTTDLMSCHLFTFFKSLSLLFMQAFNFFCVYVLGVRDVRMFGVCARDCVMCAEARGRHPSVLFYCSLPYFFEADSFPEPGVQVSLARPEASEFRFRNRVTG